ncbi:MAG: neutral/alkaline non-lysosomal ceramidase N-terminal domain-containing protein [Pseudomonadota bacterium]
MNQRLRCVCLLLVVSLLSACGDSGLPRVGSTPVVPPPAPGGPASGDLTLPALSLIAPPSSREKVGEGEGLLRFELRLSEPSDQPVTVQLASQDDSASAGQDYTAVSQTVTIPAGERRVFVPVRLRDDATVERDESFTLKLSTPVNARLELASAIGRIVDDEQAGGCDPLPTTQLCAGAAEGALRMPIGAPLGGYLRPPVGGEYLPDLERFAAGDPAPFFNNLLGFIPTMSEGGGVNVTPPNEARKSPYSTYSPSTRGYNDSLVTKAVALTSKGQTIVFVKLDVVGMIDELGVKVGELVKARTGIDLGNGLIMSATHTHDGPGAIGNLSLKYFWIALDAYHPDLFDRVVSDVADVVVAALENRVPARFGYDSGLAIEDESHRTNSFRRSREPWTEARVAEQDLLRRRIGVFRVDQIDATGAPVRPLAVMVNYAAHGIVFDVENLYFSGDGLAGLERSVESRFDTPVVAMLVQAAGGDVSPRTGGGPKRPRLERFGEQMAPQILSIFNGISSFDTTPTLRVLDQRLILSREALGYTGGEYPYPFGAVQCNNQVSPPLVGGPSAGQAEDVCVPATPPGPQDLADNGVAENDAFVPQDTRLAVAQVGQALLMMQPGEPVVEQGLQLIDAAAAMGFARRDVFIWGYSLDHVGYILPDLKDDWLLGDTEGTTTFWGWKQGGRFLAATKDLLAALKAGAAEPADEFELAYTDLLPRTPPPATLSPQAGQVLAQPQTLTRFAETAFVFEGGDPVIDLPLITLQEEVNGLWQPMRRFNGRPLNYFYEFWLDYALTNGSHGYTVRFEPAKDFPVGRYRYHVAGKAMLGPGATPYEIESEAFDVQEAEALVIESIARSGDAVSATLSYTPVPENYRLIEAEYNETTLPPPVRAGVVRFAIGTAVAEARTPVITKLEDGRLVATYTASLPGSVLPTATARDAFGNRSTTAP